MLKMCKRRTKPLLFITDDELITYSKGSIHLLNLSTGSSANVGNLKFSKLKRILCNFRIFERLLRLEPRAAQVLDENNIVFSHMKNIYRFNLVTKKMILELNLQNSSNNPLMITHIKDLEGFSNTLVFGEYFSNESKGKVKIYSRDIDLESNWEIVYEFPDNSIRHIHGVVSDKQNNRVIILTGDSNSETGIYFTKDNFKTLNVLYSGEQKYRTCNMFFIRDILVFFTDAPSEQNYAYYGNTDGSSIKRLKDIDGPVIYSTIFQDKIYFSTSVEPEEAKKGLLSLLFNFKAKGVKSNQVAVYSCDRELKVEKLVEFRSDIFPLKLFQFATVHFPSNSSSKHLVFYPTSVHRFDGKLIKYEVKNEKNDGKNSKASTFY